MKKCPKCGQEYDNTWGVCLDCGDTLAACGTTPAERADAEKAAGKKEEKAYFRKVFAKFDSGISVISWNWFAALFQLMWYVVKGLWPKVFLYGVVLWALQALLTFLGLYGLIMIFWALALLYFGMSANYDYYLYRIKGELFWPKAPYKKLKAPFWAAIIALIVYAFAYQGYAMTKAAAYFSKNAKPEAMAPFTAGSMEFGKLPDQWSVYKDPPQSFSLSIQRPVAKNFSETLSYKAFPGTRFIGYVAEGPEKERVYKGLVALMEQDPAFFKKFGSPADAVVIDRAKLLTGIAKRPFYMKWLRFLDQKASEAEYLEFSGQRWGHIENDINMVFGSYKMTIHLNGYWTVSGGKAVYLVTESFTPFNEDVRSQAEGFLRSLRISAEKQK